MSESFRRRLSVKPVRTARPGVVTAVSTTGPTCTVMMRGGEVVADLNDQTADVVSVGTVVTLLPIGETYEVISTRSGTAGGGGLILGPELLPNPSFEYGPGGTWSGPSSWTIEWNFATGEPLPFEWDTTPSEALSGSGSVKVSIVAGTWTHAMNVIPTIPVQVDPSTSYQVSAWAKADDNTQGLAMTLWTYTADTAENCWAFGDGMSRVDHGTPATLGAAYQPLTGNLTVPVGHHYARVALRTAAPESAVVVAHWDLASLRQRITS